MLVECVGSGRRAPFPGSLLAWRCEVRFLVFALMVISLAWGCCDCKDNACGAGGPDVKFGGGDSDTDGSSPLPDGGLLDGEGPKPDGSNPPADAVSDPGQPGQDVSDVGGPDASVPDGFDGTGSDESPQDVSFPDSTVEADGTGADATAEAGLDVPGVQWMVATAPDWLNMRDGPGKSYAVVRAIPCGGQAVLDGDPQGNWSPVIFEGVSGWVTSSFLVDLASFDPAVCPGPPAYEGEVPGSLVTALDVPPYVEQDCKPATYTGWPFEAQKCTYNGGLKVTVADPSPELVAQWIVDAAQLIPALWAQKDKDPTQWKKGLKVFATQVLYQSSRIFPLEGQVDEGTIYVFLNGVTTGCSTGCFCRINSLMRQQWCDYADAVLGIQKKSDCIALYSTTQWTDEWADHCLDNHRAAWTMLQNQHFRAMAWWANEQIKWDFSDPQNSDGAAVVAALNGLFSD